MATSAKVIVLIAHDDPLLSVGLKAAFHDSEEFEVVVGDTLPLARTASIVVADFDNGVKLAAAAGQLPRVMIVSEQDYAGRL